MSASSPGISALTQAASAFKPNRVGGTQGGVTTGNQVPVGQSHQTGRPPVVYGYQPANVSKMQAQLQEFHNGQRTVSQNSPLLNNNDSASLDKNSASNEFFATNTNITQRQDSRQSSKKGDNRPNIGVGNKGVDNTKYPNGRSVPHAAATITRKGNSSNGGRDSRARSSTTNTGIKKGDERDRDRGAYNTGSSNNSSHSGSGGNFHHSRHSSGVAATRNGVGTKSRKASGVSKGPAGQKGRRNFQSPNSGGSALGTEYTNGYVHFHSCRLIHSVDLPLNLLYRDFHDIN